MSEQRVIEGHGLADSGPAERRQPGTTMISLRPARFDELGLRRALANNMVSFMVAAMAFLAALSLAGWIGAAALTEHWEHGAGATLTVQVPRPGDPDASGLNSRVTTVQRRLESTNGVNSARLLTDEQLDALLRPWFGTDTKTLAVAVPAVIAVHLSGADVDLPALSSGLAELAPGTVLEDHAAWSGRLATLARSLQLCAGAVLLIVALVTAAVIAVATRSGLAARHEAILIVHQLGATDSYIAHRFAFRALMLGAIGGAIGGMFALPVVFTLTTLAAPLAGGTAGSAIQASDVLSLLPWPLWLLPVILPIAAAAIGFVTAEITMHQWLRRLP